MINQVKNMNNSHEYPSALLAIFCNLEDNDQKNFLPWLKEEMFQARIDIGFKSCATFELIEGYGQQNLTMYEVLNLAELYDTPYQALRTNRSERDQYFHSIFQDHERYILNILGPSIGKITTGFHDYIFIERFNIHEHEISDYHSWLASYKSNNHQQYNFCTYRTFTTIEGPHNNFCITEFQEEDSLKYHRIDNAHPMYDNIKSSSYKRVL